MVFVSAMLHRLFPQTSVPRACLKAVGCWVQTETVICSVAEADKEDVDKAVKAARKAFDQGKWPKTTGAERGRVLNKLADLIEENIEEIARLETLDNGKPLAVARAGDITLCVKYFRYFAGWADKIYGKTVPIDGPMFGYTLREPIGVVAAIVPWNFSALMAVWKLAPALAAGCTVVLKSAEQTPLTALRIGDLAMQAGLPAGALNILSGYGPTAGAALTGHNLVDKISFTGSTEVGRIIGAAAAKTLKPVTLELGGKSAAIVWKDVDIKDAAAQAYNAVQFNMGQCCAAGTRTFVHADIYDQFVEETVKLAEGHKVGSGFDADTRSGPQVDKDQFEKILGFIKSGKEQGASLKTGGKRVGDKGYFIEPTVFSDVQDDMTIAKEEIFGPVQTIMKISSVGEALQRANANEYGLAAGIWAKDIDVINTLSRGLRAGTVWVNTYNQYDAGMPFGGFKNSGIGRDKGEECLENFTQTKAVYQSLKETAWL
mmetsp:Transcript_8497/g.25483  ORF Transcript_8497/g.25483 Transcript_8497/m.25483 type:complete len:487 (+) Transcript_8497:985-2445(+)